MQPLPESRTVRAKVSCVVNEYGVTYCRTEEGQQYAIIDRTPGVRREELVEGTELELEVTLTLPRILRAKLCN